MMANRERGMARFTLLKKFELEERWVHSLEDVTEQKLHDSVNFEKVNRIWNIEEKAKRFLIESLDL